MEISVQGVSAFSSPRTSERWLFLNLGREIGLKKLINTVQLTERENVRELLKLNTSVGGHRSIKDIYRKVIHANGNETAKNCSLQEEKEGRK